MTTKDEAEQALSQLYVKRPSTDPAANWHEEDIDECESERLRAVVRSYIAEVEAENARLKGEQDADQELQETIEDVEQAGWSPRLKAKILATLRYGWCLRRSLLG